MKKGRTMLLTTNINSNVLISLVGNGGVNGCEIDGCSARLTDMVERFIETAASKRMRQAGRTMLAGIGKATATAMNAVWQLPSYQQLHLSSYQHFPVHPMHSPDQPASRTQSNFSCLCGSQF